MLPTLCTTQTLVQSEHHVRIPPHLALTLVVILEKDCPSRNIKALHEIGKQIFIQCCFHHVLAHVADELECPRMTAATWNRQASENKQNNY